MKKKWMIRVAVLIGTLMAALLVAAPAMAMWDWCDVDPSMTIANHAVALHVAIQGNPDALPDNIAFTVSVPKGTVLTMGDTQGLKVKVKYNAKADLTGTAVVVSVNVNSGENLPIEFTVFDNTNKLADIFGFTHGPALAFAWVIK
jgi:hypothetical protein